jgi:HK97 gp10 family phage protein
MGLDSNQRRQFAADRDQVGAQMAKIINRLHLVEDYIGKEINKKALLKKAAKPMLQALKTNSPIDKGNLKNSMAFLTLKRSKDAILVGPRYYTRTKADGNNTNAIGPHAHLIEFGWKAKNGKRIEGKPFIKQVYNQTKMMVLSNLENEIQKLIDKSVSNSKNR